MGPRSRQASQRPRSCARRSPLLPEERVTSIALGQATEYYATNRGVFVLERNGMTRRHLRRSNSDLADDNVYQVLLAGPDVWAATRKEIRKILSDPREP